MITKSTLDISSIQPLATSLQPTLTCNASALRSNLAIALYLLPRTQRRDALLFYKFCRTLDQHVDDSGLSLTEKESFLNQWLSGIQKEPSLLPADFREMIVRRDLDTHLLCEIIHGMQMDLLINRYATFEELRKYTWRVASAVGLISTRLFGAKGAAVNQYAENLGIALQLTNILRDVAEDATMGRIYLPLEDLHRFNVSEEEILEAAGWGQATNLDKKPEQLNSVSKKIVKICSLTPSCTHLFHHEAERALSYFAKATLAWEKMLPHEHRLMRPARLMESIYRTLLDTMQRDRYDLFQRRYRVGMFQKIILTVRAWI